MERLVLVCQSAYLLSIGESISEDALANEADVLLKELQKRTKEQPNAHKRPIYVGIYELGPQLVTNSGKLVGVTPKFSSGTPEEYVEAEMIYPEGLLAKNIEGYVLCEFTIDKTGVVLRPHILKSTHSGFAEEVLRIVKGMPNWIPATTENKAVETNYTLYVPFRIQTYREHLQKKISQK